jgi:protocatechuate 3,4-dioxygenase beta subunit
MRKISLLFVVLYLLFSCFLGMESTQRKIPLLDTTLAQAGEVTKHGHCTPTPPDELGPFYTPNAPERTSVGKGHVLTGTVRSSSDCSPIERARIEFWLAGPDGKYDDDHRATIFSDKLGVYTFESNFPPRYSSRPSHIHIKVTAQGYKTLITQYYPASGQTKGEFDLVITLEERIQ